MSNKHDLPPLPEPSDSFYEWQGQFLVPSKNAYSTAQVREAQEAVRAQFTAHIQRLEAENEALRKDAERWRTFLKTRPAATHDVINQAIDALMLEHCPAEMSREQMNEELLNAIRHRRELARKRIESGEVKVCNETTPMPVDRDQMGQRWFHEKARCVLDIDRMTRVYSCPVCKTDFVVRFNKLKAQP